MDELIAQQISYYQARAGEYDEWFLRQGRYDRGPEINRQWFTEVEEVRRALDAFAPGGDVLELAGGTGLWTEQLLRQAGRQDLGAGGVRHRRYPGAQSSKRRSDAVAGRCADD